MRALSLNLLAAMVSFVVGTAVASLGFKSNHFPQESGDLATAVTLRRVPPILDCSDCPRTSFRTSNMSRIASMLYQLIEYEGVVKSNTFYVLEVEDDTRGGEFAQVYWKEDRSVMFISPPYDAENFSFEWLYSKRIDLDHDVVPTDADVGSSNYLVPRPFIQDVLKKTVRNGVKITIVKSNAQM